MTQPSWAGDIEIDAPLAARLVAAQFPQLAVTRVEPLGVGWDNAAFLIDGRTVFRFPRRRIVAGLIAREIAVLPQIAPYLPLAVPAARFLGIASAEYPYAFAGYDLIPGVTACSAVLSEADRAGLAKPLAEFLRALHAIDPEPLTARGLPPDELGRLDHERRMKATRERLPALVAGGAGRFAVFAAWLDEHPPVALDDEKRRVVHGDLYARHILLDEAARPAGIIDWGDVHVGDPAIDIAIAHLVLPMGSHAAFREAYGAVDDRTWNVARYRAIYHALLEIEYGLRAGDDGMQRSGLTALRLIDPALDESADRDAGV